MAHNIETMFSVREKPWHYEMTKDRTRIIQAAPTSADALIAAGLDWNVESKDVYDENGAVIPGYKANTRDSDGSVLGIVSNRYTIVQNKEAFDFTDSLIGEAMHYETAGSLRDGKQVWLLGQMPDQYICGDKTEPYICFSNTHDGSGAVRVCMTPIRVVCNNTLNFALSSAQRSWSARHVGKMEQKLEEARETLQLAEEYMKGLKAEAEKLALQPMSSVDVSRAVRLLLEYDKMKTKQQKENAIKVGDQIVACMFAPDLANFFNTKFAFVNAVSDYVGHAEPSRHTKNYEANNWGKIMAGHPMLDKAMAIIND